jgi:hypothetical protein
VTGKVPGFCRIMIPKDALDGQYAVMLDGISMPSSTWRQMSITNGTALFLYMTYPAGSHQVWIIGASWMAEYPTGLTLVLFMIVALLAAIVHKENRPILKTMHEKNGIARGFQRRLKKSQTCDIFRL